MATRPRPRVCQSSRSAGRLPQLINARLSPPAGPLHVAMSMPARVMGRKPGGDVQGSGVAGLCWAGALAVAEVLAHLVRQAPSTGLGFGADALSAWQADGAGVRGGGVS